MKNESHKPGWNLSSMDEANHLSAVIDAKKYAWPLSLACGARRVWWGRIFRPRPHAFPPFGKIGRRGRKASPAYEAAVDDQVDARAEGRR